MWDKKRRLSESKESDGLNTLPGTPRKRQKKSITTDENDIGLEQQFGKNKSKRNP